MVTKDTFWISHVSEHMENMTHNGFKCPQRYWKYKTNSKILVTYFICFKVKSVSLSFTKSREANAVCKIIIWKAIEAVVVLPCRLCFFGPQKASAPFCSHFISKSQAEDNQEMLDSLSSGLFSPFLVFMDRHQ